ncbi:transcriptional regulator, IclR family [Bradyrhizobium erythrophlei]|nr:transcriptional regulator, IclR family [Bradyrhizobium erythrophlei]
MKEDSTLSSSSSFAKGLSVLEFFREGRMSAHLEDIVKELGMSRATAYRYLSTLCDAGLLAPIAGGTYVLGPKIIEMDRLIRISDPLLIAGSTVMNEVSAHHNLNMLLASYYRDSVMCIDIAWPDSSVLLEFERGRPMSLFRGAMAKIILANLTIYQLRTVALNHADELRNSGLGPTWPEFRAQMMRIARQGYALTRAEMIPNAGGISAPIFSPEQKIVGSITFVVSADKWQQTDFEKLGVLIQDAAKRTTALMVKMAASKTKNVAEGQKKSRSNKARSPAVVKKARSRKLVAAERGRAVK